MKVFRSSTELYKELGLDPSHASVPQDLKDKAFNLAATYVFSDSDDLRQLAKKIILNTARDQGIYSASIYNLYKNVGCGDIRQDFTVPAINIRALTFDTSALLFSLMQKHKIGPLIFEIAKSEMGYTQQRPEEYSTVILAAAIYSGYNGPVFIQGDHFQVNPERFRSDPEKEIAGIEDLIREAIKAEFFQIDIDASTIVDLEQESLYEQQKHNFEVTARLTGLIREIENKNDPISIGGEIGHIGGKNSSVEEFQAFMQGYNDKIGTTGISKVSVQTGSSHGGVPLADGTIKKVSIDFSVLSEIGKCAKKDYGLAGAVQHGASTLPTEYFDKFPQNNTIEIHLATGFQNTVYDRIPKDLHEEINTWVEKNLREEWSKDQSKEQFLYKSRKKAFGPFKKQLWELRREDKEPIIRALEAQFEEIFMKLNIYQTSGLLKDYER